MRKEKYDKILKYCWDNVRYNMIDYPSVETVLQNFDQGFVNAERVFDKKVLYRFFL